MKYKIVEVQFGERFPPKGYIYNKKADATYALENDFNVGTDGSGFWSTPGGLKEYEESSPGEYSTNDRIHYVIVQDLEPERNEFGIVTP